MTDLLSIIIPLYNREKLITETVDSIQKQTYGTFEVIIIDDHSQDNSLEIIKNHVKEDTRFKVIKRQGNIKGAPACRNEGIQMASGNYIMFLDSDDIMASFCVEQRIKSIRNNSGKNFYVFNVALFSPMTNKAEFLASNLNIKDDLDGFIKYTGGWHTSGSVFKSEFLKNNLSFDLEAQSWQDVEFHIRAILKSDNYMKFPASKADIFVRIDDGNRISNSSWTFEKLYSRIHIYLKIQSSIYQNTGRDYKKEFGQFYFYFLEIAARKLRKEDFLRLYHFWSKSYPFKNSILKWKKYYLLLLATLSKKEISFLGGILYKLIRIPFGQSLKFPQKKRKLNQPIEISGNSVNS